MADPLDNLLSGLDRVITKAMDRGDPTTTVEIPVKMLAMLGERLRTSRTALREISKLGSVCPDFETCQHPACADSCNATLLALEALRSDFDLPGESGGGA